MKQYILTEHTRRILEMHGYDLNCYRCGRPFSNGEIIHRQLHKLFHEDCYEERYEPNFASHKLVIPKMFDKTQSPGFRVRLLTAAFTSNPGVNCPLKDDCLRKHGEPVFLLRHHSIPNLELWQCECKDVLIRVER